MVDYSGVVWKETLGISLEMVAFSKVRGLETQGKRVGKERRREGKEIKTLSEGERLSRLPGQGNRGTEP